MVSLSRRRKEARLQSYDGRILTARKYNATIFGMILYGLVANFLICHTANPCMVCCYVVK